MPKKLIYLVSFALLLSLVSSASADLVAYWPLNGDAIDVAGNHHGTLVGGASFVNDTSRSIVLSVDGVDGHVEVPHDDDMVFSTADSYTIMAWVYLEALGSWQTIMAKSRDQGDHYGIWVTDSDEWMGGGWENRGSLAVTQVWVHIAYVQDGAAGTGVTYIDGAVDWSGGPRNGTGAGDFWIGGGGSTTEFQRGMIDEVRVYNHAMTEEEIQTVMLIGGEGYPYSSSPVPADGALLTVTWVSLGWRAGDFAVSHDVYLGDNFDDVNDGTPDSSGFRGNQDVTLTDFFIGFIGYPYPDGLVQGTTYYWRIDEVNDTEPNSPWKGDVWSFMIPSKIAYDPDPADSARYVDPNVELNWTGGLDAELHYVYFGDNFDDVNSAVGDLFQADTTYTPGPLELDKTYYWRVDESDFSTTQKGDVWSFKTLPDIPITDPNLVGWWKLDEGERSTTAVDWSGHGNHAMLQGDPQWVLGYDGGALEFDGVDDHAEIPHSPDLAFDTSANYTVTAWVNLTALPGHWSGIMIKGRDTGNWYGIWVNPSNEWVFGHDGDNLAGSSVTAGDWHHLAVVYANGSKRLYLDGFLDAQTTASMNGDNTGKLWIGGASGVTEYLQGKIDDARVYSKALTQAEIWEAMRGDPLLAWGPMPANSSTPNLKETTPLRWSPGENASQHDVYFGNDRDAVADADTSTADIYRGRQFGTSYTPPDVEWGGGPYYWRVDEYNTDATISTGRIWSFTVADYILVEDFEDYNDYEPDTIFDMWMDGWGVDTNGSEIGYATPDFPGGEHFVETNIVHGGSQSMPYFYDTNFKYSEATYSPTRPNWTEEGVGVLSLWFRGNPVGFVEEPVGTYTMSGAGTDIWDMADEFRYAYKQLSGDGSIVAQVLSVENTNDWAKAGVMIRESLDPGSKHAFVCITPGSGKSFQNRKETDLGSSNSSTGGFTAPYWVKLVRQGNLFTAYHSEDGVNWVLQAANAETANPEIVSMGTSVYIGLALTSHSSGVTCMAEFSDVETTGTVTPLTWTHEAIGATMYANDPAPMYVSLNGSAGVYHGDLNAPLIDTWTEWTIDLQEFTGVNLTNVNTLAIGFGDKNNLQAGGTGLVLFDDIRLYRPEPEPEPQP